MKCFSVAAIIDVTIGLINDILQQIFEQRALKKQAL
jgi:hypothetical protein